MDREVPWIRARRDCWGFPFCHYPQVVIQGIGYDQSENQWCGGVWGINLLGNSMKLPHVPIWGLNIRHLQVLMVYQQLWSRPAAGNPPPQGGGASFPCMTAQSRQQNTPSPLPKKNRGGRAYIHTYVRTYIHTYVRTYMHTYIQTDIHTYIPRYLAPTGEGGSSAVPYRHGYTIFTDTRAEVSHGFHRRSFRPG